MPLTKVDYSKTIIYKIQHRDIDELLYVGSTTDFTRRKAEHKRRCNNANDKSYNSKVYQMIRKNGGFDCFNIIVIKEFPCSNKREALAEEDRIIREMKSNMNKIRAYVTPEDVKEQKKQYYEQNKEQIAERQKQYYEQNKEQFKQYYEQNKEQIAENKKQYYEQTKEQFKQYREQYREQNKEHYKQYREQHKEQIAEYQKQNYERNKEQIAERQKQYRELHKEQIAERMKQYRELNNEKILEYQKQNYERNKEQIEERMKQKITCECGCILRKDSLLRHTKTKKHQNYLLNMTEQ